MHPRKRALYKKTHLLNYNKRQLYWDLDYYLARDLAIILRRFKAENTHSFPPLVSEGEWSDILDRMIWSFEQVSRDYPEFYIAGNGELKTLEERTAYVARVKEGLSLFGIHFQQLWD